MAATSRSSRAECLVKMATRLKMTIYLCGDSFSDAHIVPLLRRAGAGDQNARVEVQQCLGEVVLGWLRNHPNRETACRLESEDHYIAAAFERFWQVIIDQRIEYDTLADALPYLLVSLNGTILERLRHSSRVK